MVENALNAKGASLKVKITVKTVLSVVLIALAVGLPQIFHLAAGAESGIKWMPMYIPVLIGGCILGVRWGLGVAVLSPVASFLITSSLGSPMPAAARLPFMAAELAVFALVTGLFSKKIDENGWMAFPAVLIAQVSGRAVFIALVAIFQSAVPFTVAAIWEQVKSGLIGLVAQAFIIPFAVMGVRAVIKRNPD